MSRQSFFCSLQKGRDEHDGREDRETGEDECQVFHGFASFFFFGAKKMPEEPSLRANKSKGASAQMQRRSLFYHPDCTVGTGIPPVRALFAKGLRTVTAGRELTPVFCKTGISPCLEDALSIAPRTAFDKREFAL